MKMLCAFAMLLICSPVLAALDSPGFEEEESSWVYFLNASRTESAFARTGDFAAVLSSDATNGGVVAQEFATTKSTQYEISCYVSHVSGEATIQLFVFNPDNEHATVLTTISDASCSGYQRISGIFTAADATSAIVVQVGADTSGEWLVDDCNAAPLYE